MSTSTTTRTMLKVEGVHKWMGDNHVLRGVDLQVRQGEIVCILGPSGSGKSTLLRCINHLDPVDGGIVEVGSERVGYEMRRGVLYEQGEHAVARVVAPDVLGHEGHPLVSEEAADRREPDRVGGFAVGGPRQDGREGAPSSRQVEIGREPGTT